ncbi:MAG TPA: hypothetical protein VJP78_06935 [Thermoleophilia bacterium]|nr:hypothetical protein [Thermoleophilia bacterium]
MVESGWSAAPEFLELPLVPGSARDVPPWVLAGPVLARLAALLKSVTKGYEDREVELQRPRGRILWKRYLRESLATGAWHHLPCRFSDLTNDPFLRRALRWTLERVRHELVNVGGSDLVAAHLAHVAHLLLETLRGVLPEKPRSDTLGRLLAGRMTSCEGRQGLEAILWVVDERGLGGGRELDGLSWQLALENLWEQYVESVIRREVAAEGGEVLVGRLGQTVFPLNWTDSGNRSMRHLVPDIVVRRGKSVRIIDAKYKAHLADVEEQGWWALSEDVKAAHRADLHQVLAYASLYDADVLTATLAYPLRRSVWQSLKMTGRDVTRAELTRGGRSITLELRGIPFGRLAA